MVYQVKDKADFEEKLKEAGSKLVVVDFYATWCGPCKTIAPIIQEMSTQMEDVVFLKVDVDECEDIAGDYSINCMPTFLYFKNGVKVAEFSGANEKQLQEMIVQYK